MTAVSARPFAVALVIALVVALLPGAGARAAAGTAEVSADGWYPDPALVPHEATHVVLQREEVGYLRASRSFVAANPAGETLPVVAWAASSPTEGPAVAVEVAVHLSNETWRATFRAPTGTGPLKAGSYVGIGGEDDGSRGSMWVDVGAMDDDPHRQVGVARTWNTCVPGNRGFVVDDIAHDATWRLTRLRVRFSLDCGDGHPDMHGQIAYTTEGAWTSWPPDTWLPAAPPAQDRATSTVIELAATKSGVTFACRLDGAPWLPCSNPTHLTSLVQGDHRFEARATDEFGNVDPTPVVHQWRVDTVPPALQLTAAPASFHRVSEARFAWSVEPGAGLSCSLDEQPWQSCASPHHVHTVAEGQHRFRVRATDSAGNTQAVTHTWTLDATPPVVRITEGPVGSTVRTDAVLSFAADEPGTVFSCQLDDFLRWEPCASPRSYGGLWVGRHDFLVRGTDRAGNISTPQWRTWHVTSPTSSPVTIGGPSASDPSPVSGDRFADDDGHVFEGAIEAVAAAGIARGCDPPANSRYCPDDPVTRGQMAAFLQRALALPSPVSGDRFADDDGHVFEGAIEAVAAAGIARGCDPPANSRYCPDDPVTRGQMAAFLQRALDL